ncbi:hypothetical protein MAPG_05573 [Magnaporthiopsis poae ATCC 64411]|uniref:Uncharacterized protein n=1 Tax=Magnaporthiopsis poae (strain ATCC 64411 / 73-15) TaxID=644358 RepID=A0A0C4DZR7_MAGP6|nr:hypothetical protein MAPG_05573 [Magnaporthiopsis poae ATCC 64411]
MFSIMPLPVYKDYHLPAHHNHHNHHHATAVPSPLSSSPIRASSPPQPLSPRDHNERRRQIQSSPIKPSRFASRPARPNPVVRGREGFQEARRNLFLKKVQQRSDDRRWERRGVESKLQSAEWFEMDRARRQAKMLDRDGLITESDIADAESLFDEEREFDRERQPDDDMMVDAMLPEEEEAELEALISSSSAGPRRPASPHWAEDDDDDYDALFMDLISKQETQLPVCSGDVDMS